MNRQSTRIIWWNFFTPPHVRGSSKLLSFRPCAHSSCSRARKCETTLPRRRTRTSWTWVARAPTWTAASRRRGANTAWTPKTFGWALGGGGVSPWPFFGLPLLLLTVSNLACALCAPAAVLSHGSFLLLQTPEETGPLSSINGCGVRSCDSLWEKRTNVSRRFCLSVRAEEVSLANLVSDALRWGWGAAVTWLDPYVCNFGDLAKKIGSTRFDFDLACMKLRLTKHDGTEQPQTKFHGKTATLCCSVNCLGTVTAVIPHHLISLFATSNLLYYMSKLYLFIYSIANGYL